MILALIWELPILWFSFWARELLSNDLRGQVHGNMGGQFGRNLPTRMFGQEIPCVPLGKLQRRLFGPESLVMIVFTGLHDPKLPPTLDLYVERVKHRESPCQK